MKAFATQNNTHSLYKQIENRVKILRVQILRTERCYTADDMEKEIGN